VTQLKSGIRTIHVSCIQEAARKGTREKARKAKVKVEVQKIGFIPHNLRGKNK
jgi:large subunit ribosomal protein L1